MFPEPLHYIATSFLLGAKVSNCLRCCSDSTVSSHAKMASRILSNGSFRCPRRMPGGDEGRIGGGRSGHELLGRGTYVLQAARTTHRYCRIFLAQEHWAACSSGLYQLYKEEIEEEDVHGELV